MIGAVCLLDAILHNDTKIGGQSYLIFWQMYTKAYSGTVSQFSTPFLELCQEVI